MMRVLDSDIYKIIMTSITWAGPRCVQEPGAILAPQNRIQGRSVMLVKQSVKLISIFDAQIQNSIL